MIRTRLILLCLVLALPSCRSLFQSSVSRVSNSTADSRSFGRSIDDAGIYTSVNSAFIQSSTRGLMTHVTPRVYEGHVYLFGNVANPDTSAEAERLAKGVSGAKDVTNDIHIGNGGDAIDSVKDSTLKGQITTRLLTAKGVTSANYTVEVWDAQVYLIGTAQNEAEKGAVEQIARTTGGVTKVTSYILLKDQAAPESGR